MSAFEFYSKTKNSIVDRKPRKRKRKNKEMIKTILDKKPRKKLDDNSPNKSLIGVLNNIYNLNLKNSIKTGQKLFEWLIHPIDIDDFMK